MGIGLHRSDAPTLQRIIFKRVAVFPAVFIATELPLMYGLADPPSSQLFWAVAPALNNLNGFLNVVIFLPMLRRMHGSDAEGSEGFFCEMQTIQFRDAVLTT